MMRSVLHADAPAGRLFEARWRSAQRDPATSDLRLTSDRAAYAGLCLFVILLYLRPSEMFPGALGSFELAKLVMIPTLLMYMNARLRAGKKLTCWPLEAKAVLAIGLLGVALLPIALFRDRALHTLLGTFGKVFVVFLLLTNLIDDPARLRRILKLSVLCMTVLALAAVWQFLAGEMQLGGRRVQGIVGGLFEDPNDLATAFNVLLPAALALALTQRGAARLGFFLCAAALACGVAVSLSRGGFFGLVVVTLFLCWKYLHKRRPQALAAAVLIVTMFLVLAPAGYRTRLSLAFSPDLEASSAERLMLLRIGARLALEHAVIGIGMGNYKEYSYRDKSAHNSYLEIATELGLAGLAAYLLVIFAPLRPLRRIEGELRESRRMAGGRNGRGDEFYHLSIALQAMLVAYSVCSLFLSMQYLWHLYMCSAYAVAFRSLYENRAPAGLGAAGGAAKEAGSGAIWTMKARMTHP